MDLAKQTNQYLTFVLAEEIFALDITSVREVLEMTTVTRIPRTPEFMRGVINLRGHAVPVVDMRLKFGLPKTEATVNTCIIIVEVEVEGEETVLGALVDSVREVVEMPAEDIEPAPRMGTSVDTRFIRGIGKQDAQFVIILDIDKVFSADELALARSVCESEKDLAAAAG
ncbi:CheW protein [Desulfovibrio sp. X2]|nr:CheW protein [Desulfovibrio sp. X2]